MSGRRRTPARATSPRSGGAVGARPAVSPAQWLCVVAVAVLAVLHMASVASDFKVLVALHRWLMTYAEGYHRRGLVGTVFQFLVDHQRDVREVSFVKVGREP